MTQQISRRQQFIDEINEAMDSSPYSHQDKNLHQIYCIGLLRELLAYSAVDLMEVRHHIKLLATEEFQEHLAQRRQEKPPKR